MLNSVFPVVKNPKSGLILRVELELVKLVEMTNVFVNN